MTGSRIASWLPVHVIACLLLTLEWSPADPSGKPRPGERNPFPAVFRKGLPSSVGDLKEIETHVQALVARVSPAVVSVRVGASVGSAVVISKDGLVLCAAHVCGAPQREVRFTFPDGRTARGETLGTNHEMDAGLMKISDPGPWPYVQVAAPDAARIGDWVLALGHPGGFDAERSVVVRLGRVISQMSLVQTDCTLISGDSGGPLFDPQGHVIGIHSRISESTTDNYHVPIRTYLETWDRLAQGENWGDERPPRRSTIGVRAVDDPEGCRLERVNADGPGYAAGLQPGDVVLQVNGEPITDAECLVHSIRQINPGTEAALLVKRDGSELSVKVKVEGLRGRGGRGRPDR